MSIADDLERIARQERELHLLRLDAEVAWELGCRLRTMAIERGHRVAIDVRRFGQQLFYTVLEGTSPNNAEWVRRKGNTVARFYNSSYSVGLSLRVKGTTLEQNHGLATADYASHGGSFPLHVEGAGVVGSATVSGLPQRSDHDLVVEALCALLGRDYEALKLGPEES